MRRINKIVAIGAATGLAFLAGTRVSHVSRDAAEPPAKKPIYYVDPMHPGYKSDKPGIAPDCGMALEPVFSEVPESDGTGTALKLSDMSRDLAGIQTTKITLQSGVRNSDAIGRVVADETRIDHVTALADGVVRSVSNYAEGSYVPKDALLATYFVASRDIYNAVQAFVLASGTFDQAASSVRAGLINSSKANSRTDEELLKSYGLTVTQIKDLARTREVTRDIDFRSPIAGVVLARNTSRDQLVTRGTELFRIADLSHVWVLAAIFEDEAEQWTPGSYVDVSYGKRVYRARVSDARQFSGQTRSLQVRLELDNPGLVLRPEMLVDVHMRHSQPIGISVPTESVLDTGRSKVVFVKAGMNTFAPRSVTLGSVLDGRTQVTSGLQEGDEVVTSGMFLLDSESRLHEADRDARPGNRSKKMASVHPGQVSSESTTDPVCGMPFTASADSPSSTYKGTTVRFCSKDCKEKFDRQPAKFSSKHKDMLSMSKEDM